jgi:fructose-1,6-bisphosphatase II
MGKKSKGHSAKQVTKEEATEIENRLFLEAMRMTEQAAIAASRMSANDLSLIADERGIVGRASSVEKAGIEAIREMLEKLTIDGNVIGEESDVNETPQRRFGQKIGKTKADTLKVDIALDALNGPDFTLNVKNNLVTALVMSEKGGLLEVPNVFVEKLIVGPRVRGRVQLKWPIEEVLRGIATSLDRKVKDLTIAILDDSANSFVVRQVREAGASVKFISSGDLTATLTVAMRGTNIHAVMGLGEAREAVLVAAALKCLGGEIQARFKPHGTKELELLKNNGLSDSKVYTTKDLVSGQSIVFAATGITDGDVLKGVRLTKTEAKTHTVSMTYQAKTVRFSETTHFLKHRSMAKIEI